MIRLIDAKIAEVRGLPSERIVNVRVIEQNGERAITDINGQRVEAKIEGQIPRSFLAFVERSPDGMKLRVLSGIKDSPLFTHIARDRLLNNLRIFLLQNGFPLEERHLNTALLLTERGIRLARENFKLLLMAGARYGDKFAETVADFMGKGVAADEGFPEFLFRLRDILREILDTGLPPEDKAAANDAADKLKAFFSAVYGEKYDARMVRQGGRELLVQSRVKVKNDIRRYIFDISDNETGNLTVAAESGNEGYRITVYINKELYGRIGGKLDNEGNTFYEGLRKKLPHFGFALFFRETSDEFLFYRADENEEGSAHIPDLDIFV
ncbi:MAG: hypothetical protein HPY53_08185 [Brevinematales bacterium]|nr:hypothetical protein [Brevinematales bacterium]